MECFGYRRTASARGVDRRRGRCAVLVRGHPLRSSRRVERGRVATGRFNLDPGKSGYQAINLALGFDSRRNHVGHARGLALPSDSGRSQRHYRAAGF
jgi:hypothetical protein